MPKDMPDINFELHIDDREVGMKLPPLRKILYEATGQKIIGILPSELIEVYQAYDDYHLHQSVRKREVLRWAKKLEVIN